MHTSDPQSSWIDVPAIERQLTALWAQASDDAEHGGVIHSSILNLLAYVPDVDQVDKVNDLLTEVTASHPCRALLILVDRASTETRLTAEVTSRCTLPTGSSTQICCEQVTINAAGEGIDELASAVPPLLLSDLPVYLWWRTVPRLQDKALFRKLADISDRVIIDSAMFNDPHADLAGLATVLRNTPRWTALSDLNWARLGAWRALIAGFYDVVQYRPLLDHQLSKTVVEYAPPADADIVPARPLLLAGWLASRLGWKLDASGTKRTDKSTIFEFAAGGKKVTIELVRIGGKVQPGHIGRVSLSCSADGAASFSVWRSGDGQRIETSVTHGEEKRVQRVLSYEALSEAALVGKEVEILGHDRVYEQAVIAAAELVSND